MSFKTRKQSLYTTVALVIVATVVAVMGTDATLLYISTEKKLHADIERESTRSLEALKPNLSNLIEAYAVNDYNNLVLAELERRNAQAIVVEDYNMGEILGEDSYVSGKLRQSDGTIVDYDPKNPAHRAILNNCYYIDSVAIDADRGKQIGNLTVCISGKVIKQELRDIVSSGLINTLFVAVALIILLIAGLHRYLLTPLSDIAHIVKNSDESGIPASDIPPYRPTELNTLSEAMNHMLDAIRDSQQQLKQSELRWKFAVEGSGDGLWDWNLRDNSVYFSPQWKKMLGYQEEEIANRLEEWSSRVHPNDLEDAYEDLQQHLSGKNDVYINQHRVRCKNGEYIWILDRGIVVERDDDGTPLRLIGTHSDVTRQVQHEEELKYSATHDSLTGLPNRFLFSELIQQALYHSKRNHSLMALLYVDLDGFKQINDQFGHEAGDHLLITMAERMRARLRGEDIVARLGGDEFAIAITELSDETELDTLIHRLMFDLRQVVNYQSRQLQVSASIGITFYPQAEDIGPEALLRQADHAMYEAKGTGKSQFAYYSVEDNNMLRKYQRAINNLHSAIQNGELELYYQPKVDMPTAKVLGFEALLRWNHPEQGLLAPGDFLPLVNHSSELMLELGEWVFRTALRQMNDWKESGYNFHLSINVSAYELKSDHTTNLLEKLLQDYPAIAPSMLELEILETNALEEIGSARRIIDKWHQLGIKVALDDFGTGYSTLGYLKNLPVDTLKIDKSFVMDMLYDSASFSILEAAMGLARAFRCNVVAEGVESISHGELLIQLGCNVAQGYGIAKPMPADKVSEWSRSYNPPSTWKITTPLHHKDWTILYVIVEHRNWFRMVERYVSAPEAEVIPELDDTKCRFGEWLHAEASSYSDDKILLNMLEKDHRAIHNVAKRLINDAAFGRYSEVDHSEFEHLHNQLLQELNQLI